MKTVFGVEWPIPSGSEIIFIFFLILTVFTIFIVIKYLETLKKNKQHDSQLFLYKLKRAGFTNSQVKIINSMVALLNLANPLNFLKSSELFESAAEKYLSFLKKREKKESSLKSICRDIAIIYDKLYYPAVYKKPLHDISEIENNQIIYIVSEENEIFLGKITGKDINKFTIKLFMPVKDTDSHKFTERLNLYVTRIGDAEYQFESNPLKFEKNILDIEIPEKYTREFEFRHPYVDVIIPCDLNEIVEKEAEIEADIIDKISGTVFKLNDYETVVRVTKKLDYQKKYSIEFAISDYKFSATTSIISNRTIVEKNIFYYTLKFEETSGSSKEVLKKFVTDNL